MVTEVLNSYRLTLDHLHRLVADVPDNDLARQPPGLINHPAWVIGHLTYSCQVLAGIIGLTPWLSDDWERRFGTGSIPTSDRSAYPPKAELLTALADGQARVSNRLVALGDAGMAAPLPDALYRVMFPTVGHVVVHILAGHTAVHVGQVTVWRRAAGYPPLKEPVGGEQPTIKRLYFPCRVRLNEADHFMIWYQDEHNGFVRVPDGRLLVAAFSNALANKAAEMGINLELEARTDYDFDRVRAWCKRSSVEEIDFPFFLETWNFFDDLANLNLAPSTEYAQLSRAAADCYDKLFWGNNLPSVTPHGECFEPSWSPQELEAVCRVFLAGLSCLDAELVAALNCVSQISA